MSLQNNKKPVLSIVMVNYNGLQYLRESIPSLLTKVDDSMEIIVVDNGSTDGSIDFLKSLNSVQLISSPKVRQKNFACNFGCKHAKGDIILLLDNDIVFAADFQINDLLNFFESKPAVGCVTLAIVNRGETLSRGYGNYLSYNFTKSNRPRTLEEIKKRHGMQIGHPSGIAVLIRKNVWDEVGGYDDFFVFGGDDNDLGIKLWMAGYNNYLYSKNIQEHIGMPERSDIQKYALKLEEMTHAHLVVIVKNYSAVNALLSVVIYSISSLLKGVKQSIRRKSMKPLWAVVRALLTFVSHIKESLKKRRDSQTGRVIKHDIFLKIK